MGAKYDKLSDKDLYGKLASILVDEKVVWWFKGHMEFGPRALGGRSIIESCKKMQSLMNLKIKYRSPSFCSWSLAKSV